MVHYDYAGTESRVFKKPVTIDIDTPRVFFLKAWI
jgi:hypothetical protein